MLTWSQRFRFRVWVRSSMWLIPLGFVLLAIGLAVLMPWIDRQLTSDPPFTYSASSAQSTLSAIASGMLVFTGFVFSILTFAIQFGSSSFTPRLLRSIAMNTQVKVALGVFVATFFYSLLLLADIAPFEAGYVPQFSMLLAVVLVGAGAVAAASVGCSVACSGPAAASCIGCARSSDEVRSCGATTTASVATEAATARPAAGRSHCCARRRGARVTGSTLSAS